MNINLEEEARLHNAARMLQALIRGKKARNLLRELSRTAYEKHYDSTEDCWVYMNKFSGKISKTKPVLLGDFDIAESTGDASKNIDGYVMEPISINMYAVIVTVNEYLSESITNLSDRVMEDHERLVSSLTHDFIGRIKPNNLISLKNCNKDSFVTQLTNLSRTAQNPACLFVYMCTQIANIRKGDLANDYFLFKDSTWTPSTALASSSISSTALAKLIKSFPFTHKTVLLHVNTGSNLTHGAAAAASFFKTKTISTSSNLFSHICNESGAAVIGSCSIGMSNNINVNSIPADDDDDECRMFNKYYEKLCKRKLVREVVIEKPVDAVETDVKKDDDDSSNINWIQFNSTDLLKPKVGIDSNGKYITKIIPLAESLDIIDKRRRSEIWSGLANNLYPSSIIQASQSWLSRHSSQPKQSSLLCMNGSLFGQAVFFAIMGGVSDFYDVSRNQNGIRAVVLHIGQFYRYLRFFMSCNLNSRSHLQHPTICLPLANYEYFPLFARPCPPPSSYKPFPIHVSDSSISLYVKCKVEFDGLQARGVQVQYKSDCRAGREWRVADHAFYDYVYEAEICQGIFIYLQELPKRIPLLFRISIMNEGGWSVPSMQSEWISIEDEERKRVEVEQNEHVEWMWRKAVGGGLGSLLLRLKFVMHDTNQVVAGLGIISGWIFDYKCKRRQVGLDVSLMILTALKIYHSSHNLITKHCFTILRRLIYEFGIEMISLIQTSEVVSVFEVIDCLLWKYEAHDASVDEYGLLPLCREMTRLLSSKSSVSFPHSQSISSYLRFEPIGAPMSITEYKITVEDASRVKSITKMSIANNRRGKEAIERRMHHQEIRREVIKKEMRMVVCQDVLVHDESKSLTQEELKLLQFKDREVKDVPDLRSGNWIEETVAIDSAWGPNELKEGSERGVSLMKKHVQLIEMKKKKSPPKRVERRK